MAEVIAVILLAAGAGVYGERRWPARATRLGELGMSGVLWFALPVIAFFNFARFEFSGEVGIGLGFAYLGLGCALAIALVLARRMGMSVLERGAFLVAPIVSNTAFLGIPFVATLIGFSHVPQAIAYDLLVSAPMLLIVAFAIGAGHAHAGSGLRAGARAFFTRNPALYAAVAGLLVPDALAPDWAIDFTHVLIVVIAPVGFFALGAFASRADDAGHFRFPPPLSRPVAAVSIVKLTVPVAVMFACSRLVHAVPDTYLIQAAMPTGINALLLVSAYRLDRSVLSGAIVWTTAVVLVWGLIASLII